jgi:Transposase
VSFAGDRYILPGLLARHRRSGCQEPRTSFLDAAPPSQSQSRSAASLGGLSGQHPVLETIYRFKQRLCYLLLKKHRTRKQCEQLVPRFLRAVYQLRQAGLGPLVQLGQTLASWSEEIVAMWRFTRNNGITEGFHNKMELINRQAYGFRNFQNYRLRVKVLCS